MCQKRIDELRDGWYQKQHPSISRISILIDLPLVVADLTTKGGQLIEILLIPCSVFFYIGDVFLNNPKVFICDTNFCHDSIMYFEHGFADRLTVEDTGACRV